ncbi:MAG TPA: GNAT family N-acetyltransferase [bacterium]|nr:GNAT family N-acetyltransferase [bacterium]
MPPIKAEVSISLRRKPTVQVLKDFYAKAWWTARRGDKGVAAVLKHSDLLATAWKGKELVGFARVSTDFAYRAVLWDVIVDRDHQGVGLGSRLVRAILEDARLKDVESFWLFTTDKQPFYRRLGFKAYPKNVMVWRKHVPPRSQPR